MDYQKIHEKIMNLDPNIRLVTICDTTKGSILYTGHRDGVKNLLTPKQSKESLDMAVKAWKTRAKLAPRIGKGKYVLAEYEKLKRITMPFGRKHLLYITTEVDADHAAIISGVERLRNKK